MFGTWDIVRPRHWHPMASLEQSMMEDTDLMLRPAATMQFPSLLHDNINDDDEFFSDLPVRGRGDDNGMESPAAAAEPTGKEATKVSPAHAPQQQPEQHDSHTFSTYSFSNSSIVDDKGRRVASTRRRYEDSNGRLKALHERQIEGQKMRSIWNRLHKHDTGHYEQICSDGTPGDFETAWKQTPFGHATHAQLQTQQQTAIKDQGKAVDSNMDPAAKAS